MANAFDFIPDPPPPQDSNGDGIDFQPDPPQQAPTPQPVPDNSTAQWFSRPSPPGQSTSSRIAEGIGEYLKSIPRLAGAGIGMASKAAGALVGKAVGTGDTAEDVIRASVEGKPLPVEQAAENIKGLPGYLAQIGLGVVETLPKLGLTMAAPPIEGSVFTVAGLKSLLPSAVAAGGIFGMDDQGTFHPKSAIIGALMPPVMHSAGELVSASIARALNAGDSALLKNRLAQKFLGVLGSQAGLNAYMLAADSPEIIAEAKDDPEKAKKHIAQIVGQNLSWSLLELPHLGKEIPSHAEQFILDHAEKYSSAADKLFFDKLEIPGLQERQQAIKDAFNAQFKDKTQPQEGAQNDSLGNGQQSGNEGSQLQGIPARSDLRPDAAQVREETGQRPTGGGGPEPSPQGETPGQAPVVDAVKPPSLTPALLVNGRIVSGGATHEEVFQRNLTTTEDPAALIEAHSNDAHHVFVDENGQVLDRKAAGAKWDVMQGNKLGTTPELQSQMMEKPKAAAPVEPPAAPAGAPEGTVVNGYKKVNGRWYRVNEDGTLKEPQIPANKGVHAARERDAARPAPPPETRTQEQVIGEAKKIKIKAPEGSGFIRVTQTDGRVAIQSIKDAQENRNPFEGVDVVKIEHGTKDAKGNFVAQEGEVRVTDAGRQKYGTGEKGSDLLLGGEPAATGGDAAMGEGLSRKDPEVQAATQRKTRQTLDSFNGGSAYEALKALHETDTYKNPLVKVLVQQILSLGDKGIKLNVGGEWNFVYRGEKLGAAGRWEQGANTAHVYDAAFDHNKGARTILHEYIHGLTSAAIDRGDYHAELTALFFAALNKAEREKLKFYGLGMDWASGGDLGPTIPRLHEFVAEAFSNKAFQEFLSRTRSPLEKGVLRTLWDKFLEVIGKIVGVKPSSVLSDVLKIGGQIASERTGEIGTPKEDLFSLAKRTHDIADQTMNWEQMDEGQRRETFTDLELQNRFAEDLGNAVNFTALPQGVQNKLPWLRDRIRALGELRGRGLPQQPSPASFDAMMADPNIRPEVKQVIAGDMVRNLLDFRDNAQRTQARAGVKIAEYENKVVALVADRNLERERRSQVTTTARELVGAYQNSVIDRIRQAEQTGESSSVSAAMRNLERLKQNPEVVERVIQQIANTVPAEILERPRVGPNQIFDALLAANGGTLESLSAAIGETGTQFSTDWVRHAIEVMRVSDNLGQIVSEIRATIDPENWRQVQALATELRNVSRRGVRSEIRAFAREIAVAQNNVHDARATLAKLNPKLSRAVRQLDQWSTAQDVLTHALQDPQTKALEQRVYSNFDVQQVVVERGGDHQFIFTNPLSGEKVTIFPTLDPATSPENYAKLQNLMGDAATYLANHDSPTFDPKVGAAWRYLLDNTLGFWLNPSLNASLPHMTPFRFDLPAFLGAPMELLRKTAGLEANAAQVSLNAASNARRQLGEVNTRLGARVDVANKAAAKAANMTVSEWHEKVFNELVARMQFIGQVSSRVGDVLLSGHRVTELDMKAARLQYDYGRAIRDVAENADSFSAANIHPQRIETVVGETKVSRKAIPTGELTLPSRRSGRGTLWALTWREMADPQARLRWLNDPDHFERIVMAHVSESESPGYTVNSPLRAQYRSVMNDVRADNAPVTWAELSQRVFDAQDFARENANPLSVEEIQQQLYREIDKVFGNFEKEGQGFTSPKPDPLASIIAAENSFTKPRSERRGVPFTFYDYGAADAGGRIRLANDAYVWHTLDFVENMKAMGSAVGKRIAALERSVRLGATTTKEISQAAKTGNEWYDLGELKLVQKRIKTLLNDQTRVLQAAQQGSSSAGSVWTRVQSAVGTYILMTPGARATHTFGMLGTGAIASLQMEGKVLRPVARDLARKLQTVLTDLTRPFYLSTEKVRAMRAAFPIAEAYFDMDLRRRDQLEKLKEAGIIPESDIAGVAQNTLEDLRNVFRRGSQDPLGKRVGKALSSTLDLHNAMGRAWSPQSINDVWLNSNIREQRKDMVRNWQLQALKSLDNRQEALGSGYSDFSRPENVPTSQEITGMTGATADRVAFEQRRLFKVLGMDLDHTMLEYHRAVTEAKARGEDPSGISFMTPEQERSLDFQLAQERGLATMGTRNLASQGSVLRRTMGYIHGLPLFVAGKNIGMVNRLSSHSNAQHIAAMLPVVLLGLTATTVAGLARIQATASLNRLFYNQASALPTIAQAKTAGDWARLLTRAQLGWWPIIGDVVLGMLFKTPDRFGHLDSMFVMLNFIRDLTAMPMDMIRSHDVIEPARRFLERWFPPSKILIRRTASQTGVSQHFNALADIQSAMTPGQQSGSTKFRGAVEPSPTTPMTYKAINAMYNGDWKAFQEAHDEFIKLKTEQGAKNPEASFRQSMQAHNPWLSRLGKLPTDDERQKLLDRMTPEQRDEVLKAEKVFREFGDRYGANVSMTAEESEGKKGGAGASTREPNVLGGIAKAGGVPSVLSGSGVPGVSRTGRISASLGALTGIGRRGALRVGSRSTHGRSPLLGAPRGRSKGLVHGRLRVSESRRGRRIAGLRKRRRRLTYTA